MFELIYPAEGLARKLPLPTADTVADDEGQEFFPVVETSGEVTGRATRAYCHSGSKLLHPVVHLHIIDRSSIFAQTYTIFILSWPCQLVVEIILERILKTGFYACFPAMLLTGLTVPLILIKLTDYIEYKTNTKIISLIIGKQ